MENEPNAKELAELSKLSKAGSFHFKLLLITLAFFGLVFVVPESFKMLAAVPAGVLLLIYGISFINLQFFQCCPRCNAKLNQATTACINCGLLFFPKSKKGAGNEWPQ